MKAVGERRLCGCEVRGPFVKAIGMAPQWDVFYCPLHAAAERLAGALRDAQETLCGEWCSGTYHAAPCREPDALLKEIGH